MKLKEIYLKNQTRRYSSIKRVKKENISLNMNPERKIKENWIQLLAVIVVTIALLLLNFKLTYFLVSLSLILVIIAVFIFGNKATLFCDKNSLNIQQGFQKNIIPYANLKCVYIGRVTDFFLFIPIYSYNIIIRYEDAFSFLRELQFPLLCATKEDVNEFLNNFEVEENISQRYVKYEKRKFWKRILSFLISITLAIILCIYLFQKSGINFNSII